MANQKPAQEKVLLEQIKMLLSTIDASGKTILPQSNDLLLKSIVEAAARIFNAAAASILLVNEQEKILEFKVAHGASNRELVGMKFPMDKGIAGYVVMTGQPLSISNVRQDPRFNQDFAKSTGYVPNSILATPLLAGDRVIGVMEVLDKVNASAFGIQDMELLAMFANQAAIAIEQSIQLGSINRSIVEGLKRISSEQMNPPPDELIALINEAGKDSPNPDLLQLADLFAEFYALREPERKACLKILRVFLEYHRSSRRIRL